MANTYKIRTFTPGKDPVDGEMTFFLIDVVDAVREALKGDPERVSVLFDGERRDMFVMQDSAHRFPRNDGATDIYRANWMANNPTEDPESLPAVYGPAILFLEERVWF